MTIGESATQSSMEYDCLAYHGWRRHACLTTRRRVSPSVISFVVTSRSAGGSRKCRTASGCSRRLANQCLTPGVPVTTIFSSTTTYQISTRRGRPLRRPTVLRSHVPVFGPSPGGSGSVGSHSCAGCRRAVLPGKNVGVVQRVGLVGRALQGAAVVGSAVAVASRYRAWHLSWGATFDEVVGPMPGDDLLDRAHFVATRAVSISAPPDRVWPWLVQVGFGRAGFYSYDLLDNLGRSSAHTILDDFQSPTVGDVAAPMSSSDDERTAFRVAILDEPRSLLWTKPDSTWSWRLTPEEAGGTRLVTRLKARYDRGPLLPVTVFLMELGDFPMMRRMLLGIAERAERHVAGEVR